jgi:hypothetical protein
MNKGIVFMGMGFELLGAILGGLYLGAFIDKEMGWPGYGTAATVVACLVSWMVHLVYMLKKFMEETPDDPQP